MPMDVQRALNLGQFVYAAENPSANPFAYNIPFGYQLVNTIYGNDLATDINPVKDIVPFGFVAKAPAPANDLVVAIRGTASIWEWIQDARYNKVTCPFAQGAGQTEDGFTDVYMSMVVAADGTLPRLVDVLKALLTATPGVTLTVTGHSLGASLATLLALDVKENAGVAASVVTFASPLVGDSQFTLTYNTEVPDTWRIANTVDLIPKLPPVFWGYDEVNQLFPVNSFGKVKLVPACAHHLTTYLYLLSQLGPGGNFPIDADCRM
jgi:pimeloyl-ACP methyl ester carboxylesterase